MQLIKFFNLSLCAILLFSFETVAQRKNKSQKNKVNYDQSLYSSLKFREVGPFRGGRSCAVTGVDGNPNLFYFGSDHFANFLIVKNYLKTEATKPKKQIFRRNLKKVDSEKLNTEYTNVDWYSKVETETNIDVCFENIINTTTQLLDKHAPLSQVSQRKIKYSNKPYIDAKLLTEIRHKNKLFQIKKLVLMI